MAHSCRRSSSCLKRRGSRMRQRSVCGDSLKRSKGSMRRFDCCKLLIAGWMAILCLPVASNAVDTPPRVLGYERQYVALDKDRAAAGQLLLGELNCTACHVADEAATQQI